MRLLGRFWDHVGTFWDYFGHFGTIVGPFWGLTSSQCHGRSSSHVTLPRGLVKRSFYESGVPFVGVLATRALLFGVCIRTPDLWKLPCQITMRRGKNALVVLILQDSSQPAPVLAPEKQTPRFVSWVLGSVFWPPISQNPRVAFCHVTMHGPLILNLCKNHYRAVTNHLQNRGP